MMEFSHYKLEIYVPESHFEAVRAALFRVDAGHIGNYDHCLSWSPVRSCWRPLTGTHPWQGTEGALEEADEVKVEVTVTAQRLAETLDAVREAHPYEEPVIQIIPLCLSTGEKNG